MKRGSHSPPSVFRGIRLSGLPRGSHRDFIAPPSALHPAGRPFHRSPTGRLRVSSGTVAGPFAAFIPIPAGTCRFCAVALPLGRCLAAPRPRCGGRNFLGSAPRAPDSLARKWSGKGEIKRFGMNMEIENALHEKVHFFLGSSRFSLNLGAFGGLNLPSGERRFGFGRLRLFTSPSLEE